jgi:hypothetical protein
MTGTARRVSAMQSLSDRAMAAFLILGWAAFFIVTGYLVFFYLGGEILIGIET